MNKPKIFKVKNRWWEIWKPLEEVKIICNHDWEILDEYDKIRGYDECVIKVIKTYKCLNCGKFKEIEIY